MNDIQFEWDGKGEVDMLPEYDFSKGERGKFYKPLSKGYSVQVTHPDGTVTTEHYRWITQTRLTPSSQGVNFPQIPCIIQKEHHMAELSRFFGIIIRMFAEKAGKHHTPYFHAVYQENEAVFSIDPIQMISGSLPIKQRHLVRSTYSVEAWSEIHQDELWAAWHSLEEGKRPSPISPLH